jgi:hypothetical protein
VDIAKRLRLLAVAALLTWAAAPALALGVALHELTEHHHSEGELAAVAALAASHGHGHSVDTPDHDHSAVRPAAPPLFAPAAAELDPRLPPSALVRANPAEHRAADRPSPTGSPPLFYAHCALLL